MLEQTSSDFRERFLLKLTKEIIENTNYYRGFKVKMEAEEIFRAKNLNNEYEKRFLDSLNASKMLDIESHNQAIFEKQKKEISAMIEKQKQEVKETIRGRIKEESEKLSEMRKSNLAEELSSFSKRFQRPMLVPLKQQAPVFQRTFQPLRIPEQQLPETVSYVKPIATSEEIDLGRMNALIHDPLVKVIECNGSDDNLYVMGIMGRKKTPIKLSKEEISQVVKTFSESAKIPSAEGLFKAAFGNLVISAVVSDIVGTQFIIRKISQEF